MFRWPRVRVDRQSGRLSAAGVEDGVRAALLSRCAIALPVQDSPSFEKRLQTVRNRWSSKSVNMRVVNRNAKRALSETVNWSNATLCKVGGASGFLLCWDLA
jgi:hypothetical protein